MKFVMNGEDALHQFLDASHHGFGGDAHRRVSACRLHDHRKLFEAGSGSLHLARSDGQEIGRLDPVKLEQFLGQRFVGGQGQGQRAVTGEALVEQFQHRRHAALLIARSAQRLADIEDEIGVVVFELADPRFESLDHRDDC